METARYWTFNRLRFEVDTHHLSGPGGEVTLEPRVAELLEVFLKHHGEVLSHDFLIETVWQGRAVSDEAVRRAVSNLRRTLSACGADNSIKTVHKMGYVSRLQPERGLGAAPASRPAPGRPWSVHLRKRIGSYHGLLSILGVALLALVALLVWREFPMDDDETPARLNVDKLPIPLAVLPFNNLVPDSGDDALSDSMAEELISRLARVDAFRVTARSSSFQFRGDNVDLRAAGEALGVRYLVEGSVRREAGKLRVGAALVDARSGFQTWAGSYDRDSVAGLFAVQQEIAREVARALQVVLVRESPPPAVANRRHAEARLAYARGQALMSSWVQADIEAAMVELQRAIELDASFAPAYVLLAHAMSVRATNIGIDGAHWPAARAGASRLVNKALELNPDMGEAYVARSLLYDPGDLDAVEKDLRKGLQLSPSYAEGYEALAQLLYQRGDLEESAAMIDKAIALDPLRPRNYHFKTYIEFRRCDIKAVVALSEKALSLNSRFRASLVQLARVRREQGRLADSLHYLDRAFALEDSWWIRLEIAVNYMLLGQPELARAINQPPNPKADLILNALAGDDRALARTLTAYPEGHLKGELHPVILASFAYRAALATGEAHRFITLLQQLYPSLRSREGQMPDVEAVDDDSLPAYPYLYLLYAHAGRNPERLAPDHLASRFQKVRDAGLDCSRRNFTVVSALIALLRGDRQGALAEIRRGVDSGKLGLRGWHLFLTVDPAFASLRSAPEFEALAGEFDRRASTQWARYLAERDAAGASAPQPPLPGITAEEPVRHLRSRTSH